MNATLSRRRRRLALSASAVAVAVAASAAPALGASTSQSLVGTFAITKGTYAKGAASGSYFRMVYPGGSLQKGKFFANPDSSAKDKTYTLISPGTDKGLVTGRFQQPPKPAFDAKGDSLAGRIIKPTGFSGIRFGLVTAPKDASGTKVSAPSIKVVKGKLSGDLRAFTANWNNLAFNQGSPKPDGSRPATTNAVTGTYDAKTRHFVLTWSSAVVGGPFNGFTGSWHLEGTFRPAAK